MSLIGVRKSSAWLSLKLPHNPHVFPRIINSIQYEFRPSNNLLPQFKFTSGINSPFRVGWICTFSLVPLSHITVKPTSSAWITSKKVVFINLYFASIGCPFIRGSALISCPLLRCNKVSWMLTTIIFEHVVPAMDK